ncbi:MAG TPA: hypothetical protein VFQ85_01290 [Mycobacteriales bacterium]|jgi:hypothetical protein|nr:hypothetical protein [Mycobacteriales bacterium]
MKIALRLALSAAAVAALAVPATAHAESPYCDKTFLPSCEQCVDLPTPIWEKCVNIGLPPAQG